MSSTLKVNIRGPHVDLGNISEAVTLNANGAELYSGTLTGDVVLTVVGSGVVGFVAKQDATGGHTVTVAGQPVTVDTAANARTLVEFWPLSGGGHRVTYPDGTGPGSPNPTTLPLEGRRAVAYGDSNTWLNGYQSIVKDYLGLTEYVNRGVNGGEMAAGIQAAITGNTDHDAFDIVTVWASGNDFTNGRAIGTLGTWDTGTYAAADTFLGGYRRSLDHILADNPTARIILVTITNRVGKDHPFTNTAGNTLDAYNDAIRAVGNLYALPVCEMNNLAGFNEKTLSAYTYDGLHMNAAGFQRTGLVLAHFIATHAGLGPGTLAPDTTPPTWAATLTVGTPTDTSAAVTASALATDDRSGVTYEVALNGTSWAPISPAGDVFTLSGLSPDTSYSTAKLRAKDASGNPSTALSIPTFTTEASASGTSSFTFLQSATQPANTAGGPHTFAAQNIGAAAADRTIFAVVSTYTDLAYDVDTVTIGGVAATVDVVNSSAVANQPTVAIARAVVPSGTTADVVVTYTGGMNTARASLGLYRLVGATPTLVDTEAPAINTLSVSGMTTAAGGILLVSSGAASGASGATPTWTGIPAGWVHNEFAAQGGTHKSTDGNPASFSVEWSAGATKQLVAASYSLA